MVETAQEVIGDKLPLLGGAMGHGHPARSGQARGA